jgi:hypothetical protein
MSQHTEASLQEILAERGRPVDAAGLARARKKLADADDRRDLDARARLLEQLRSAA